MDNDKKLFEELLKADGIDPAGISESERERFRAMLDREQKRLKRTSWISVCVMWFFALALIALNLSENLLEKMHIPFAAAVIGLSAAVCIFWIKYLPAHNKKLEQSQKNVNKLYRIVHGKNRGFALVVARNGKRVIRWPGLLLLTFILWLCISLGGAGVYYLLCQRWIYSSTTSGAMWVHVFLSICFAFSFLAGILRSGFKTPIKELTEIKDKPKPPKPPGGGPRHSVWVMVLQSRMGRFALIGVFAVAAIISVNYFGWSIDGSGVAWADVVEKFRSVSSYNAVVYAKKDASSEPIQLELWVNSNQKARLRVGSQVFFAEKGEVTAVYNFKEKKAVEENRFNPLGRDYIKFVCKQKSFSLNKLVQLVQKANLVETTPEINSAAIISKDLLVFDLDSSMGNEWIRIWTLRESKLPIRFRSWNPDEGSSIDVFVNYEKQQSDDFFDHKKYEELLTKSDIKSTKEKANFAYAFLKDPGGKRYVPEHVFETSQYHMPVVAEIGITKYGAVWLVTSNAENRRKDGCTFYGFSSVSDNLGRNYRSEYGSYSSMTDKSVNIYIPENYPFDQRAVEAFKLSCAFPRKDGQSATDYVGSIEITEWKQSSELPQKIKNKENQILIEAGYDFSKNKQFEKVDKIVELVRKSRNADEFNYKLQQLELYVLIRQKRFSDASRLAKKLWPVEMDLYNNPKTGRPQPKFLIRYILAIAGNGEIEEAAKLYKQIENAKPDVSRFSKQWGNQMIKNLPVILLQSVKMNLYEFLSIAELSIEEINQIFGFDVTKNDETKWYVPQKYWR